MGRKPRRKNKDVINPDRYDKSFKGKARTLHGTNMRIGGLQGQKLRRLQENIKKFEEQNTKAGKEDKPMCKRELRRAEAVRMMRKLGIIEEEEKAPLLYSEAVKRLAVGHETFVYFCDQYGVNVAFRKGKGRYYKRSDIDVLEEAITEARQNGTMPKNLTHPKEPEKKPEPQKDDDIFCKVAALRKEIDSKIESYKYKQKNIELEIKKLTQMKNALNLEEIKL